MHPDAREKAPLMNPSPRMPGKNRRWLGLGLGALVLVLLAWFARIPEKRELPFRAMPPGCPIVAETLDLARNWHERLANPLAIAAMRIAGVEEPRSIAGDADLEATLRILTGKRAVLGYVPEIGPTRAPAFVGASYVGMRAWPMRVLLAIRHVPGLGPLEQSESGALFLRFSDEDEEDAPVPVLGLDLKDGVLLAAWSTDPDAIRTLAWRAAQDALPVAPVLAGDEPWRTPLQQPVRAWTSTGAWLPMDRSDGSLAASHHPVRCAVRRWNRSALEMEVDLRLEDPPGGTPLERSCAMLDALPDDPPIAVLALPRRVVEDALRAFRIRLAPAKGDACLALVGSAYGARLLGVDVPSIQASLPWAEDDAATAATLATLWNLFPGAGARVRPSAGSRFAIELADLPIARLAGLDLVAEKRGGWLTAATSASSLDKLRAAPLTGRSVWRKGWQAACANRDAFAYLWLDLPALSKEYERLFALVRLVATFQPDLLDESLLATLQDVSAVSRDLSTSGDLCIAGVRNGDAHRLFLSITPRPAP